MLQKREKSGKTLLMIVDMQKYFIDDTSDYSRYFNMLYPGSLQFIRETCLSTVIPNIKKLKKHFTETENPVVYLRLCGSDPERKDLHNFFYESWRQGFEKGFDAVYPLRNDPMAQVIDELKPDYGDVVIDKTTFSPFSSTMIEKELAGMEVEEIVFTGLATSQCVETTARDASDRDYRVIHIYDAQADYDNNTHEASLYSSRGVCGGIIYDTDIYINLIKKGGGLI